MKTLSCVLGRKMCRSMIWMIALFTMFGSEAGLAQYIKTVIMVSGQAAPGTNGAVFDDIFPPSARGISKDGKVIFEAWLKDGVGDANLENQQGFWVAENGVIKLVARRGGSVPGLPGQIFLNDRMPKVFIDAYGEIGLAAEYSPTGNTDGSKRGFFMEELGELVLKLTPGMEILPGIDIGTFTVYAFNNERVLFVAGLTGDGVTSSNNVAICVLGPDGISVLVRKGNTMAGIGGDFIYRNISTYNGFNPLISDGSTIFNVTGRDIVTSVNIGAVYTWSPNDGIELFKKSGPDSTLIVFAEYRMNSFPLNEISGRGWVDFPTKKEIWTKFDFGINTIVTQGDIAPGAGGETFSTFVNFVLFDHSTIATLASTSGGRSGIWIEGNDGMEKVAVIGDPAPGVPEGLKFFRVNNMMANTRGEVAFSDLVVADSGDELSGIWVGDANGLSLVVVRNEQIEILPGQIRTIKDAVTSILSARTGVDGHPTNFNDANQIAFGVNFSEGGNAFVVARPGLIVNSTGNSPDLDPGNGKCETGGPLVNGKPECTLRAAIMEANVLGGKNTITFNIPISDPGHANGIFTIKPQGSPLDNITDPLVIDGTTQPGFNGSPIIVLDGTVLGMTSNDNHGLKISGGDSEVQGLVIQKFFNNGIYLLNKGGNTIRGNYIGVDHTGSGAAGNGDNGVLIEDIPDNVIGGITEAARNIISFNDREGGTSGCGILIIGSNANNNKVQGNYIGTDVTGLIELGNPIGVCIENAPENTIGGVEENARNLISGNFIVGIEISGSDAKKNKVQGNFIGTKVNGGSSLANKRGGIRISTAPENTIGGLTNTPGTPPGNLISGNRSQQGGPGILIFGPDAKKNVVQGNLIGMNRTGTKHLENGGAGIQVVLADSTIIGGMQMRARNVISGNDGDGISIEDASVTIVQNNFIGTDLDGKVINPKSDITENSPGNGDNGVSIVNGTSNLIGGELGITGNVISGNFMNGVLIEVPDGGDALGNFVQGNLIGTDSTGKLDAGNTLNGVKILNAFFNRVGLGTAETRNIISANGQNGIYITGEAADANEVSGNYIGTNVDGNARLSNEKNGVLISDGATGNNIGGASAGERNTISGNDRWGIAIIGNKKTGEDAAANVILGNYIGTDANGNSGSSFASLLGNGGGVFIKDASGNLIGGGATGMGNVIADNILGVKIYDSNPNVIPNARNNRVEGNIIGVDAGRINAFEIMFYGIRIENAGNNIIGGITEQPGINLGNLISNNLVGIEIDNTLGMPIDGENIVEGNIIGFGVGEGRSNGVGVSIRNMNNNNVLNNIIKGNALAGVTISVAHGGTANSNQISENVIFQNMGLGIDLQNNNVTANDLGDGDTGPNNFQNFPVLTGVTSSSVSGNLNSIPNTPFTIELFSNTVADITGFGEGEFFLTSVSVTTDANGNANFFAGGLSIAGDDCVTATATNDLTFDTSEFSLCVGSFGLRMVVNSTGDAPDANTSDAICNTGNLNSEGLPECTLRAAIEQTNATAGPDFILFDIPGSAPYTIQPLSGLPAITDRVNINGITQPGFTGTPVIEIDGSNAGNVDGLRITAGGSVVIGLVINRFERDGIVLTTNVNNTIVGNFIGTDVTGTQARGNGGVGVLIEDSDNNTIGGTALTTLNIIAHNGSDGVLVISGTSNAILGNAIHSNTSLGINLRSKTEDTFGVTENDAGDGDTGSNNLQNFPELTAVLVSDESIQIDGTFESKPDNIFQLDFYANMECDLSGHGEGELYLGFIDVTTDATGNATFTANFLLETIASSVDSLEFQFVTATATDSVNNTSEFSICVAAMVTLVEEGSTETTPVEFNLHQNYPNPFNPSTIIYYALPEKANVELRVYDILGSEIATLVNEEKPAGNYEIEFDGSKLSSGIYFYRLQAGSFVVTKKMVLLR